MADILIHSAVPSLFTHTESASNLFADNSTENSRNNNGTSCRLHNTLAEHPLISNNLNSNKASLNSSIIIEDREKRFNKTDEMLQSFDEKSKSNNSVLLTNTSSHITSTPSNRSSISVVNHNEEVPYAVINRKRSISEQHEFPADAIEQHKKQQRDEQDKSNLLSKQSSKQMTNQSTSLVAPSSVLKPMDHLNTIFIKPTKIEHSLPKLVFQDDYIDESSNFNENLLSKGKKNII